MLCNDIVSNAPALKGDLENLIANENLEDPLETTEAISKFIAKYSVVKKASFKKLLQFNLNKYSSDLVALPEETKVQRSFISRLFGLK